MNSTMTLESIYIHLVSRVCYLNMLDAVAIGGRLVNSTYKHSDFYSTRLNERESYKIIKYFFIIFATFTLLNFLHVHLIYAEESIDLQNKIGKVVIPTTISKESQKKLHDLYTHQYELESPIPNNLDEWIKLYHEIESIGLKISESVTDLYEPNITKTILGGINVLDIKPKIWRDNGKVLVYTHGGGYKLFSANSTLSNSVLVSNSTGLRVISINYTVAPFSKWNQTTDEVISVIQALEHNEGYSPKDIAIFGESAGGGLAAGSVLKMRDTGMDMPAAVVLWSPFADVTGSGDTRFTLKDVDLYTRYNRYIDYLRDAYADKEDQNNPYVSPVYGNFSKGFPPTLIQCGTREFLLSDSVRLYQALDQADVEVKLDIYEGMPHVFQSLLINTIESEIALSKMNDFLRLNLNY